MYFLFSLSQWLIFWTFGDSIFSRNNKVQTFISWPFGWLFENEDFPMSFVSFQVNISTISTMCLYPALQVLHSILTWLAGRFVFCSFTRKWIDLHWIKPPPSNSGKWRFRLGSPSLKIVIILVMAVATGWGRVDPRYPVVFISSNRHVNLPQCIHSGKQT